MSEEEYPLERFLRWEVKPIWKVKYPSTKTGEPTGDFTIYGVDRGALDISRNWEKINSVEQFNQGFAAKPTDFTFTIAVKERTPEFEKFRRLAKSGVYFDVSCDVLAKKVGGNDVTHGDNQKGFQTQEPAATYVQWLDGFENYIACLVTREGETVDMATIPIREFEIVFLEHQIQTSISGEFNSDMVKEGDGSFPTLDDLGL